METDTAVYRGSIKSCNYNCSYCPFSKHAASEKELAQDREQWLSFVQKYTEYAKKAEAGYKLFHALIIAPYGEALVYPWYWEGLARLSALSHIQAVGAQTNLGFAPQSSLECYVNAGGDIKKLRLWATFHPQMTTISEFAGRCRKLTEKGAALCAGAVGVPENLNLLRKLRKALPKEIYLWINKMDGLGRAYTPKERQAFSEIDPYFYRECIPVRADVSKCGGRIFTEGNGTIRLCNLAPAASVRMEEILDRPKVYSEWHQTARCGRKRCSCYLAYGGRNDWMNQALFGPFPLFRIPRRPKAAFFDIEGTLFLETDGKSREIPPDIQAGLEALAKEHTALFFATTLPYKEALRRCQKIRHLFDGGIYAGGAHIVLKTSECRREQFYYLKEACYDEARFLERKFHFRLLAYRDKGVCYKLTLLRARRCLWKKQEAEEILSLLQERCAQKARYIIEGNCLQIIAAKAGKADGVRLLCQWFGIAVTEAFAAGDGAEDVAMMELTGSVIPGRRAKEEKTGNESLEMKNRE